MKPSKPTDALGIYTALVDASPELELKGAKSKYTSLNGNMFSFLTKEDQLALRLSDEERASFLAKHPTCECFQHGTLMKHYVLVPDSILQNAKQLKTLFGSCLEHARSLKPKPTTRKKATKVTKQARKKK